MEEFSGYQEPLLSSTSSDQVVKKTPLFVLKWVLKIIIWIIFIAWIILFFVFPSFTGEILFREWIHATQGTLFGLSGSLFLLFSGPILLIAFLSIPYLIISRNYQEFQNHDGKRSSRPSFSLWTLPVLVDGPFGIVSAAELIGILLFVVFFVWLAYIYTIENLIIISQWSLSLTSRDQRILLLELTGYRLGMVGVFCLAFLFLPIARGSVLLRLIDIPFAHAVKYHVWLGNATLLLLTLHGLFYVIGWAIQGKLQLLLQWRDDSIAIFPGVISLSAGLVMWVTSLPSVRKWNFELFYYTHQLYIIFVLFMGFHIGCYISNVVAGSLFIFIIDRFLRFCQSRKTVDVLSARCFSCGTVELTLSKPKGLQYNALSFIFLQIRELSWLQWHPFSISSSPLGSKNHLSVLIKACGTWTSDLKGVIMKKFEAEEAVELLEDEHFLTYPKITASVEGPYGHEVPFYLMYENLILVAGGVGISPFLAVLNEILHRINKGLPCLSKNILVIWAIKRSNGLHLLSTSHMESICPNFFNKLNLKFQIYITRETTSQSEEGIVHVAVNSSSPQSAAKGSRMSILVGTSTIWYGIYMLFSLLGFAILVGLLDVFYISSYNIESEWYIELLYLGCMVSSIFVFGGFVVALWDLLESRSSANVEVEEDHEIETHYQNEEDANLSQTNLTNFTTIQYGSRPDFKEIFGFVSKLWGHVDIGVIVCGPLSLQNSVAREIRSYNFRRESYDPVFHFNNHNFHL